MASPLDHTLMAKNATAASRLRNDPTILPTTPKCALEETALLVPFIGPKIDIGARTRDPIPSPSTEAVTACLNDNPNMMGKAPSTAVARELAPPQDSHMKSHTVESRSASGMDSIPCCSTAIMEEGATGDVSTGLSAI